MEIPLTDPSEFARGHKAGHRAGGIDAKLNEHDQHFVVINGSIVDNRKAIELQRKVIEVQTLAIQQLVDKFEASAQAAIMLAAALKEADEARRNTAVQSAQPVQRRQALIMVTVAVVSMLMGLVGMYVAVRGG